MVKKRPPTPVAAPITTERAARLYRLVTLLGRRPQTRADLLRLLGLEIRGFYRDLETLRKAGIEVTLGRGHYSLVLPTAEALAHLPLPDPGLTLGEAEQLAATGRGAVQRKLRQLLGAVKGKE